MGTFVPSLFGSSDLVFAFRGNGCEMQVHKSRASQPQLMIKNRTRNAFILCLLNLLPQMCMEFILFDCMPLPIRMTARVNVMLTTCEQARALFLQWLLQIQRQLLGDNLDNVLIVHGMLQATFLRRMLCARAPH